MPTSGPMTLWSAVFEISVSCSTRLSIPVVRKQMTASRGVSTIGSPLTLNDVLINTGMPVNASNSLSSRYNIGLVCSRTVCTRAVPSTWTIAGILSRHSGRTFLATNMNGDSSSPSNTSLARSASTIGANGRNACRCLTRLFRISFISPSRIRKQAAIAERPRSELGATLEPADHALVDEQLCRLAADILAAHRRGLDANQKFPGGVVNILIGVALADIGVVHDERTALR